MARRRKSRHQCPRCFKCFKNESAVIKHMGQPWSDCATSWMRNLEDLSSSLSSQRNLSSTQVPAQSVPNLYDTPMNVASIADQGGPREEYLSDDNSEEYGTRHTDMYPGASRIYGPGTTFMNKFDNDQHADQRRQNIYYPFSSRSDWQLGAWLLRSHLSMESIDQFLKLDLVSLPISHLYRGKLTCIQDQAAAAFISICKVLARTSRDFAQGTTMEVQIMAYCSPYQNPH